MGNTLRSLRRGLAALGIVGLFGASIAVRSGTDAPPAARPTGDDVGFLEADPSTGAVLVDLDDGVEAEDADGVRQRILAAIAPFDWPDGDAAFGEELSDEANLYRLSPPPSEVGDLLAALEGEPDVEAVELERVWSIPEPSTPPSATPVEAPSAPSPARGGFTPNDPYYKHQWHMDQIQMPAAWASTRRGEGAVVAVIDTGVLYRDHGRFKQAPDLAGTRFVDGHDFVENDAEPDDEHGHGTHVAGTVAQSTNNALGVAGVAPGAAIMPVRVLNRNGAGAWGGVAAGIRWAADHGANVINMSLGGSVPSRAIANAVAYAHKKGVTVVAAAGNTGRGRVQYPAAYPGALAVGAVRLDGERTFYSSYGPGLGIMAPGGDLRVDQNGDGLPDGVLQNTMVRGNPAQHDYVAYQGTSMAAPHVAGAAALLWAEGVRSPDAIVEILRRTAEKRGAENDYGAGILKAGDATALGTRGLALGRIGALGGLFLVGLGALRRRGALGISVAPAFGLAFLLVGGLRLLPVEALLPAPVIAAFGGLPMALASAPWWLFPLAASALLPFALTLLLLSVRSLRPALVGLSLAMGACLLVEALVPTAAWGAAMPMLAGPWLVIQAGIVGWLGCAAARRT